MTQQDLGRVLSKRACMLAARRWGSMAIPWARAVQSARDGQTSQLLSLLHAVFAADQRGHDAAAKLQALYTMWRILREGEDRTNAGILMQSCSLQGNYP